MPFVDNCFIADPALWYGKTITFYWLFYKKIIKHNFALYGSAIHILF